MKKRELNIVSEYGYENFNGLPKDHWVRRAPSEKILTLLQKCKVKREKLENQTRVQLQKRLQAYRKLNTTIKATLDSEYSVDRIIEPEWKQSESTDTIGITISDDEDPEKLEECVRDESKSIIGSPTDKEVEEKLSSSTLDEAVKAARRQVMFKVNFDWIVVNYWIQLVI